MKTSIILIIVAFLTLLSGLENENEKYIIAGLLIGLAGWTIQLCSNKKKDYKKISDSCREMKDLEDT